MGRGAQLCYPTKIYFHLWLIIFLYLYNSINDCNTFMSQEAMNRVSTIWFIYSIVFSNWYYLCGNSYKILAKVIRCVVSGCPFRFIGGKRAKEEKSDRLEEKNTIYSSHPIR